MADQLVNIAILTPREVGVIKQYIRLATRLRTSFGQMKEYWGGEGVSAKYEEITNVYGQGVGSIITYIVEHADKWPSLESQVTVLCGRVSECSNMFKSLVDPVVETIETMPLYIDYSRTLQQEEDDAQVSAFSCPLCPEDMQKLEWIRSSVAGMERMVSELEPELVNLGNAIQSFKENLMNGVQTEIDKFVRLDTAAEMDAKLLSIRVNDYQRAFFSTYMAMIRGVVLRVIEQYPGGSPDSMEELVGTQIHPNHFREYNTILEGVPVESRNEIEALMSQVKKGKVLFAQLESLHDWLNMFGQPLIDANKGVGQIRTLWFGTAEELGRIKGRVLQVEQYSTLRNIVSSLKSALRPWGGADSNAKALRELLERAY
ncbi:hypothetical protein [Pseudomonas fluorescens]|uniref:hypothetical protein n=1 Tax=Pseudomonas TaxID=286 RepID=UPI003D037D92